MACCSSTSRIFPRAALEALCEPLENGRITISCAARRAEFPARCQLVVLMNPCPCGHLGSVQPACRCNPEQIRRYQNRISGPLLDRIDVRVEVLAIAPQTLSQVADGEASAVIARHVADARDRQQARRGCLNSALDAPQLEAHVRAPASAIDFLNGAAIRLGWSGRSLHRVLRVARTAADLAQADDVQVQNVAEAIQLRRALPGT